MVLFVRPAQPSQRSEPAGQLALEQLAPLRMLGQVVLHRLHARLGVGEQRDRHVRFDHALARAVAVIAPRRDDRLDDGRQLHLRAARVRKAQRRCSEALRRQHFARDHVDHRKSATQALESIGSLGMHAAVDRGSCVGEALSLRSAFPSTDTKHRCRLFWPTRGLRIGLGRPGQDRPPIDAVKWVRRVETTCRWAAFVGVHHAVAHRSHHRPQPVHLAPNHQGVAVGLRESRAPPLRKPVGRAHKAFDHLHVRPQDLGRPWPVVTIARYRERLPAIDDRVEVGFGHVRALGCGRRVELAGLLDRVLRRHVGWEHDRCTRRPAPVRSGEHEEAV